MSSRSSEATLQTASATLQPAANGAPATDIRVTYRGGTSGQSISYALTLDRSGSMSSSDNRNMEQAALSFVTNTRSGDEGAIVNFGSTVVVDQGLTTDTGRLTAAIRNPGPTGGYTALYDSIGRGVSVLDGARNSIKAVVCMTDGRENESRTYRSASSVINHAKSKGVPVHCVGIGGANHQVLERITDQTGGVYHRSATSANLAALYTVISNTLSSSYGIAFTSPVTFESGVTYEVKVEVEYAGGIMDSITISNEA